MERWIAGQAEQNLFLSVVTWGELRRGISLLPEGARRMRLLAWLDYDIGRRFEARVLVIDRSIADLWGRLAFAARSVGDGMGALDAFIAATALVHGMTVATRNVRHFEPFGVATLNPWEAA